jgi:hypothetical protein
MCAGVGYRSWMQMHSGRFGSRIFEMLLYKRRLLLTEVLSCSMQDVLKNKGCIIGVVKDRTHASSERERVSLSLSLSSVLVAEG